MPRTALIVLMLMWLSSVPLTAQTSDTQASGTQQINFLPTPLAMDAEGFQEVLFKVAPNVYLSGQPSEAGLARAKVADAIADAQGNVLLHCTVAWRATHLWTAYLVEHQNVPFADALAVGRQLNFGTFPLEGFLDAPLTVTPLQTDDNNE